MKFKWSPELVNEFFDSVPELPGQNLMELMEQFKARKLPSPLFVTTDGKEISDNEQFWCLKHGHPDIFNPYKACAQTQEWFTSEKGYQIFSTKEAMNNWLINNRPLLSLNDVKEVLDSILFANESTKPFILEVLTNAVKQKLNP